MKVRLPVYRLTLLAWIAGVVAVVAGSGCATPEPAGTRATVHAGERREQLRDQLRDRLGDRYDEPIPEASMEQIRGGAALYDLLCRSCHGPTGKGNGRSARMLPIQPADLSDPETAAFFSDQAKLIIIEEGIEGSPMIGWGRMMSEEERMVVLQFMNTLIRDPDADPGADADADTEAE